MPCTRCYGYDCSWLACNAHTNVKHNKGKKHSTTACKEMVQYSTEVMSHGEKCLYMHVHGWGELDKLKKVFWWRAADDDDTRLLTCPDIASYIPLNSNFVHILGQQKTVDPKSKASTSLDRVTQRLLEGCHQRCLRQHYRDGTWHSIRIPRWLAKGPVLQEVIGCGSFVEPGDCVPSSLRTEVLGEKW